MSKGRDLYKFTFELSPIFLTGGIASNLPLPVLPIVALTESGNLAGAAFGLDIETSLDRFFAHFEPIGGSTLISNEIGQYPFANQNVAANAIISKPLNVSLLMKCPVQSGYLKRTATFAFLREMLERHNSLGGLYTVVTPAAFYTNCILTSLTDAGSPDPAQTQTAYRWDFVKPLVSINDADKAASSLMQRVGMGLKP